MPGRSFVGIVLVNFNGRRFLNDCVRALSASHERHVDIVVVDNQSTDDSLALLRAEFPTVTVLPQDRNLGVAAANNVGIRYFLDRTHDFVLLLNYDTMPADNLIDELLRVADARTLVSGSTYFWNDSTRSNSHAGGFDWALGRLRERFFGHSDASLGTDVVEIEIADTCCLLIPREAFTAAGLMDEAYFLYYDDTDFVVRARAAGYRCLFNPAAKLLHYERGSSGPIEESPVSVYYTTRNRPYFMRTHSPTRLHYLAFLVYFAGTRLATIAKWALGGQWTLVYWMWRGLCDYMMGRMGPGRLLSTPARQHG
jgi:GT2 family glycosyltransferase